LVWFGFGLNHGLLTFYHQEVWAHIVKDFWLDVARIFILQLWTSPGLISSGSISATSIVNHSVLWSAWNFASVIGIITNVSSSIYGSWTIRLPIHSGPLFETTKYQLCWQMDFVEGVTR
jgi:hypothetical protein